MRVFCLTNLGLENIALKEISKFVKIKNISQKSSVVSFDVHSVEDIQKIYFFSQSIRRIAIEFFSIKIPDRFEEVIKHIENGIRDLEFPVFVKQCKKFKVECIREGRHQFKSIDIITAVSKQIKAAIKGQFGEETVPVFKDENLDFLIYINESECIFGIDIGGIELCKRDYKIFHHNESLNPNVAYSLVEYANPSVESKILDPFCGSGTIPIEVAISLSGKPVNYNKDFLFRREGYYKNYYEFVENGEFSKKTIFGFDKEFRHIRNARKNASLAGVGSIIEFYSYPLKEISNKAYNDFFDYIITDPPIDSKRKAKEAIRKLYKEFLNQSNILLKTSGKIVLVVKQENIFENLILGSKFKIIDSLQIHQGKEVKKIIKLGKKNGIM